MSYIISVLCILLCISVLKKILKGKTTPVVCVVYTIYYMSQVLFGIILYATDPRFEMGNTYGTDIKESLLPMAIGVMCAIYALYLGVRSSGILKKSTPGLNDILLGVDNNYSIETVLLFLLFFFTCSILRTFNLGYLVNLIANTFNFTTIIAGYFWSRLNKNVKNLWVIALAITFIFHMIQGSRGYALYPVIFFLVGQILSMTDKKAIIRRVTIYSIIFVMFSPVFSKIQDYRIALGRGLDVSTESFNAMIDYLMSDNVSSEDDKTGLSKSISRFVIGTNFATVTLSPSPIPYSGFKGVPAEMKSMITLVGSDNVDSYRANRADLDYGVGIAARYGFHITEFNSVEYPLFADAAARFGYLGLFIYFFLFSFIICKLELFVRGLYFKNSLLCLMLFTLLLYNGSLSYGSSYSTLGKILIFRGILITIIAYIIGMISYKKIIYK